MTESVDMLIQARFDAVTSKIDDRDWNDVLLRLRDARPVWEPSTRRITSLRRVPRRVALAAAFAKVSAPSRSRGEG